MKKKTIILIVGMTLVVGAAAFLYYRYISSPEYSLMQIRESFEQHDLSKFEKYVDSKTLISRILDKTLNEAYGATTMANKGEKLGAEIGQGLLNLMRPQVEELWMQQINKLVESGDLKDGTREAGIDDIWNKSDTASFKGIKEVKKEGKVATISLEFNQPRFDTTLVLDVKMRNKGNHWQLFDISNIVDYYKTIEELEERRVNKLNEEIKELFFQNIQVSDIRLRTVRQGYYTVWYNHYYSVDFVNISNKEIGDLICFFDIVNASGRKLESGLVIRRVNLQPKEKYSHEVADLMSSKKVYAEGLTLVPTVVGLQFTDGTKLEWNHKWGDLKKETQ